MPCNLLSVIEKKYDKPMSYWFALIDEHSDWKHMEVMERLNAQHGMGQGHANAVVAYCRAIKETDN